MIVYEFTLKEPQNIVALSSLFYGLGNVNRALDGVTGSAVYLIQLDPPSMWVQLLVDSNTGPAILTQIEAAVNTVADDFMQYPSTPDNVAPERRLPA